MKTIAVRGKTLVEQKEMTEVDAENQLGKCFLIDCYPPRNGSKKWVFVNNLAISFECLYYIVRWIGECENEKYPEIYHKGAKMVADFMGDAILSDKSYTELAREYKLPISSPSTHPDQTRLL